MSKTRRNRALVSWSYMWVLCLFDIPVRTKAETKAATKFRKMLLDEGFGMKQFSVYTKPFSDLAQAKNFVSRFKGAVPPNGSVSFIYITDRQLGISENYFGPYQKPNETEEKEEDGQLFLF